MAKIEIPLPPIGEQRKIVAKLESVLGKIKESKKLRAEAESAAAALLPAELHRIFTQPTTPHKQHTNKLEFVGMLLRAEHAKNFFYFRKMSFLIK
ncbi:restriction endonuclease subunit S [Candidatus Wolfebacteria bacterium]|nr:restriction endonuclease subunit S [Candidatus Wolfebacteria bacterium]